MSGNLLLIYIYNFHVLSNLLLIYICKLHWNQKVIFNPKNAILCSFFSDRTLEKKWKQWKQRLIEVRSDGSLLYRQNEDSAYKVQLDVTNIHVARVPMAFLDAAENFGIGICLSCLTVDQLQTEIRFVFTAVAAVTT